VRNNHYNDKNPANGTVAVQSPPVVRCAIYTRKSTDEGLEQEFNSLDAQREALLSGRDATIDALAQRLGIKRDILPAQMRLTYLAPDIIRALVLGRPADGLTPAGLLALCKDLPHDWQLQRAALVFETR